MCWFVLYAPDCTVVSPGSTCAVTCCSYASLRRVCGSRSGHTDSPLTCPLNGVLTLGSIFASYGKQKRLFTILPVAWPFRSVQVRWPADGDMTSRRRHGGRRGARTAPARSAWVPHTRALPPFPLGAPPPPARGSEGAAIARPPHTLESAPGRVAHVHDPQRRARAAGGAPRGNGNTGRVSGTHSKETGASASPHRPTAPVHVPFASVGTEPVCG